MKNKVYLAKQNFLRRALSIEKAFGSDHLNLAISLNNLAGIYIREGLNSKAEPLLEELYLLKKNHSDLITQIWRYH